MLKEYLKEHNIQQKELAKVLNIDKYQMSKIANHICLPTPEQAKIIIDYLHCDAKLIFPQDFVNFKIANLSHKKANSDNLFYRLSVRLDKGSCNCLKSKNLKLLGYESLKSWTEEQIHDLNAQLDRYYQQQINFVIQDIFESIKHNPNATKDKQIELFDDLMQKYFRDTPQCAEELRKLIVYAHEIVKTQKTLEEQMRA